MTQTLIEQLEALLTINTVRLDNEPEYVKADDLSAIIEQHKRESGEDETIYQIDFSDGSGFVDVASCEYERENFYAKRIVYMHTPPSHTKLIEDLVKALVRYSGCCGTLSDEINVLVDKAREAVKHE